MNEFEKVHSAYEIQVDVEALDFMLLQQGAAATEAQRSYETFQLLVPRLKAWARELAAQVGTQAVPATEVARLRDELASALASNKALKAALRETQLRNEELSLDRERRDQAFADELIRERELRRGLEAELVVLEETLERYRPPRR